MAWRAELGEGGFGTPAPGSSCIFGKQQLTTLTSNGWNLDADAAPWCHFGLDVPFMNHIGLESISLQGDCCHTRLRLQRVLVNSRGDIHGGALMSALDFSLGVVARAHDPLHVGAATIDMNTHFYEPAAADVDVFAICRRRGKRIAFCEGEVKDAQGNVLAAARAVFKLVPRAP